MTTIPTIGAGPGRPLQGPAPLPARRGPVTDALLHHLARPPHELPRLPAAVDDPLYGDDAALALYVCYELHYRGLDGVDDRWEWEPSLLRERARLEAAAERRLADEVGPRVPARPRDVLPALLELAAGTGGPSLSGHVLAEGTLDQVREFAVHRSAYQLKEADPHTWGIPRIPGPAKAALVGIQFDEYGAGVASRMHSELFSATMRGLGLDDRYGGYVDLLPGTTLATVNLVSLFGLHRRWRGALVGHLALFEMCSVVPMRRYRDALLRLGAGEEAAEFYDVHVEADAVHEVIALEDLAGGLIVTEPDLAADVVYGAAALDVVERRFATTLLGAWRDGRTALLGPVPW
ncbi:MAG TPA: iron-containing redox enzyme family protein [Acidimicrobiales bacterium]|jgi:hypothetical protein